MLESLLFPAAGLFMIGSLVVVHEAGHFLMARLFGVGTPVFSFGIGQRLFGVTLWDTDFRVSLLPIGGYVRMSGADPFGEQSDDEEVPAKRDFMRRPVWQRLLIMAAGPAVNVALPFFVFTALMMLGRPEIGPEIGRVFTGSAAEIAGLRADDRILAVDGVEVEVWRDVVDAIDARANTAGDVELRVERAGETLTVGVPAAAAAARDAHGELDRFGLGAVPYDLTPQVGVAEPETPAGRSGLKLGDWIEAVDGEAVDSWSAMIAALDGDRHTLRVVRIEDQKQVRHDVPLEAMDDEVTGQGVYANRWGLVPCTLFVTRVEADSPAGIAGVQIGDRVVAVDGKPVLTFSHLRDLVAWSSPDGRTTRPVTVELDRGGAPVQVEITPKWTLVKGEAHMRPIIGVGSVGDSMVFVPNASKYYGLFEAIPRAVEESVAVIDTTSALLGNVLMARADPSENVGGVISIFYTAGTVAKQGVFEYATWLSIISVSLGLFNLLPVPVLDGGWILFYLIEGIRGRPLALEIRERLLMVGVVGISVMVVLVMFIDIRRWMIPGIFD